MSGEMQVDSVKVNTATGQSQQEVQSKTEEKPIIQFNFESEAAQTANEYGLPVLGLGIEVGHSVGEQAKANIHESAENIREFKEKHPVLAKMMGAVCWLPELIDKFIND